MIVKLTWPEVTMAGCVGVAREVRSLQRGDYNRYKCEKDFMWSAHIEGACAELAFAKAFGFYWADKGDDRKSGDVAGFEVRCTGWPNGHLLLHDDDIDSRACVLAVGRAPEFRLAGWIRIGDGKQMRWKRDPTGKGRDAFFVPQAVLRPMSDFMIAA